MIKSFIPKEPVVLFFLLAMLIFAYDAFVSDPFQAKTALVVSEGDVRHLSAGFEKTWQRAPTSEELKRLIDERIREEIYYREALALQLDEADTIVRRRLRQKYEFLVEDLGNFDAPTDAELTTFLNDNSEKFRLQARLAFQQIFLESGKAKNTPASLNSLKQQLNNNEFDNAELPGLSDSFMLAFNNAIADSRIIDSNFGSGFADRLIELPLNSWQGPVRSGYGMHLVRITHSIPARTPTLDQARNNVLIEWQREQKQIFLQQHYESLVLKYDIIIKDAHLNEGDGV